MLKSIKKTMAIAVVALLPLSKVMAQCATCKAAAETSLEGGEGSIASGINLGVLYMLFILFSIFGLTLYLFWRHRNADGSISK